jgi:quinoprotein glucose dehydrogenase
MDCACRRFDLMSAFHRLSSFRFRKRNSITRSSKVRVLAVLLFSMVLPYQHRLAHGQQDHTAWGDYEGGPDNSKYVALDRITKSNVGQLRIAWSYSTRDANTYSFNPIIAGNVMYVLARGSSLVALNATTGKEIWVHENLPGISYRGVNYWESKNHHDHRLIFQINHYLEEIDADTGKSNLKIGTGGLVDLRFGLGRDPSTIARIKNDTPGTTYGHLAT